MKEKLDRLMEEKTNSSEEVREQLLSIQQTKNDELSKMWEWMKKAEEDYTAMQTKLITAESEFDKEKSLLM